MAPDTTRAPFLRDGGALEPPIAVSEVGRAEAGRVRGRERAGGLGPHALIWTERSLTSEREASRLAVEALFAARGCPLEIAPQDLTLCRDPLGKPYATWSGGLERRAREMGMDWQHLHLSNSHDGEAHLVLAAHDANLCGVGLDLVWLPRLRAPGKDAAYLRRLAARFMSEEELAGFLSALETDPDDEAQRQRFAAHFSLMEAASKALGTGLKIGGGMGTAASLPKRSLGAATISPEVTLVLEAPARQRMICLNAARYEAQWHVHEPYLISRVCFWKDVIQEV